MLPMTLQFIVVMIATASNDRLQRKLDYVEEERRILARPHGFRRTLGTAWPLVFCPY
jgi:hypothetical protein